jgi:tRNA (mo5U34)-methyltransferase
VDTDSTDESRTQGLRRRVEDVEWYHTIELAPGVITPGWFDTRPIAATLPWPALSGKRCLDVGTFDGFWAFEMERRGASEVVAIDILDPMQWDWPAGATTQTLEAIGRRKAGGVGFEIASKALGSRVHRLEMSVYDLDVERVGHFDVVYLGSLLLHLRDPAGALMRLRHVCSDRLMVLENIDLELSLLHPARPMASLDAVGRPWWWKINVAALVRLTEAAGFTLDHPAQRVYMPAGEGQRIRRPSPRSLLRREGREAAVIARRGDPHALVMARVSCQPPMAKHDNAG